MKKVFKFWQSSLALMALALFLVPQVSWAQLLPPFVPKPTGAGICIQQTAGNTCGADGYCVGTPPGTPPGTRIECDYTFCDLLGVLINISQIIFGVAGGAALVYFLWGSVTLIVSGGNAQKVEAGKESIKAALWGLLIVLIAYQLVGVVLLSAAGSGRGGAITVAEGRAGSVVKIFGNPWSELRGGCKPSELQTQTQPTPQAPTSGGPGQPVSVQGCCQIPGAAGGPPSCQMTPSDKCLAPGTFFANFRCEVNIVCVPR